MAAEAPPIKSCNFPITPLDEFKDRPYPKTAACLVIADEILNGEIKDTNSTFFARYCFDRGIELKRIEVVPDDEDVKSVIIGACQRLSNDFDFIVTSGGVGPTHDDITYPSVARAFDLRLEYHQPTLDRMTQFTQENPQFETTTEDATNARKRMALFPHPARIVYPRATTWVPIVIVNENVHILPGIPQLFEGLLLAYDIYLNTEDGAGFIRRFVKTSLPEANFAPFLTEVQERIKDMGMKVGSYPKWSKKDHWVILSFLGRERQKEFLDELIVEVADKVEGIIVDSSEA